MKQIDWKWTLNSRTALWLILALAVFLRVAVALYLGDATPPGKDETSYSTLAVRLAAGHGYSFPVAWYPFAPAAAPTSHWSFLYTGFLAAVYAVFGAAGEAHPLAARLLQAVLAGLLTPWLTYRLARRLQVENSILQIQGSRLQIASSARSSISNLQSPISDRQSSLPLLAAFLAAQQENVCKALQIPLASNHVTREPIYGRRKGKNGPLR